MVSLVLFGLKLELFLKMGDVGGSLVKMGNRHWWVQKFSRCWKLDVSFVEVGYNIYA